MDKTEKLEAIKKHFINLKSAHEWCLKHFPSELGLDYKTSGSMGSVEQKDIEFLTDKLLPAVEKEYVELEKLGVSRTFSACLFIMGGKLTQSLLDQFKQDDK